MKSSFSSVAAVVFFLAVMLLAVREVSAQVNIFTIANGDVAGLKNALTTSNTDGRDDIINLAANGTYTLTTVDNNSTGLPAIIADGNHSVRINGNGATIQRSAAGGTPAFAILVISGDNSPGFNCNVFIDSLRITNAASGYAGIGGGVALDHLTLTNCTMDHNGVGVVWDGLLSASKCSFNQNSDVGFFINFDGAISLSECLLDQNGTGATNTGNFTAVNCTFSRSSAGGGLKNGRAIASITGCTFDSNTNTGGGGGIDNYAATLTATNCTFAGNSGSNAGGVSNQQGSPPSQASTMQVQSAQATLTNCTFAANTGPTAGAVENAPYNSALHNYPVPNNIVTLTNDIFKTGASGPNLVLLQGIYGTTVLVSQGHNISDDASGGDGSTAPGGYLNAGGDLRNTNPNLISATPADYGGPTKTVAIGIFGSSPAIGHADPAYAPARDQRGYFRTGPPDTGAFEYQGSVIGRVTAIARTGVNLTDATVSFEAVDRLSYRLQRKLNITDSSWQDINGANDLTATANEVESITAPGDLSLGKAFYRVNFVGGP